MLPVMLVIYYLLMDRDTHHIKPTEKACEANRYQARFTRLFSSPKLLTHHYLTASNSAFENESTLFWADSRYCPSETKSELQARLL